MRDTRKAGCFNDKWTGLDEDEICAVLYTAFSLEIPARPEKHPFSRCTTQLTTPPRRQLQAPVIIPSPRDAGTRCTRTESAVVAGPMQQSFGPEGARPVVAPQVNGPLTRAGAPTALVSRRGEL